MKLSLISKLAMNLLSSLTDRSLSDSRHEVGIWTDLKKGDKRALSHLYTLYFQKLYNYGVRTGDSSLTEDCIQDLFIELWYKRDSLSEVKNVKGYLFKSLRRKIIFRLSQRLRVDLHGDLANFDMELSHRSHYLNQQIDHEIRCRLGEVMAMLTVRQKEAIFLIYIEELSYEQVSFIMALKVRTVYNLVHQALSKLKEYKSSMQC